MKQLTARQHEVLEYISAYSEKKGYSPTLREIMDHFSISLGTAAKFIRILKEKGAIAHSEKKWRGIRLSQDEEKADSRKIPIIGHLTKGEKIELFIQPKQLAFPQLLPEEGIYYGFISKTDSFSNKGILAGDIIIVETASEPSDHAFLLITKNEAAFFGHLIKEHSAIVTDDGQIPIDEAVIRGRIVLLFRSYSLC